MTPLDDFKQTVVDAESAAYYSKWFTANKQLAAKWVAFRDAILAGSRPAVPAMGLNYYGRMLVDFGVQYLDATASATTSATDPVPPNAANLTDIVNAFLPVNQTSPATLTDYRIDGSNDSAVLIHQNAHGSKIQRFDVARCCNLPWTNPWARHALYAKVRDLLVEDFRAIVTPGVQVGQFISARMCNQTYRRCYGEGATYLAAYFQENDDYYNIVGRDAYTKGVVRFENVQGKFTATSGATWFDVDTAVTFGQQFEFASFKAWGPSNRLIDIDVARVGTATFRFEGGCEINGVAFDAKVHSNIPVDRLVYA